MAEKAFSQIQEAESQAQALIKDAQDEAAQIIKRAEEETMSAFSRISEACKQQALEKKKQTEANAQANSAAFSKETAELRDRLEQKLLLQKSKAIDAVVRVVTA